MFRVVHRRWRAWLSGLLAPLLMLLIVAPSLRAHACEMASGCPCGPAEAGVVGPGQETAPPALRRQPCCDADPAMAPRPAMESNDSPPQLGAAAERSVATVPSLRAIGRVASTATWPRGPPGSVPIYLRCCSLLR